MYVYVYVLCARAVCVYMLWRRLNTGTPRTSPLSTPLTSEVEVGNDMEASFMYSVRENGGHVYIVDLLASENPSFCTV